MNTLKIEARLAEKYQYKPLPKELSEKYRAYFRENIPEWLAETGSNAPLYTSKGSLITNGYERIVVGDYGAFVEFDGEPLVFVIAPGQEYRVLDARYSKNVKYVWLTINFDKNDVIHRYGTCELQDADFPIEHICNIVCERCFNSRFVISENGLKAVCCLSAKKAMKCIATHDYFCAKPMLVGAVDSLHKNSMITETS